MKTEPQINGTLNSILKQELTLINQHFLHARMLKNWGYEELGEYFYKKSITAMKNADALIERIFLLEGLPNLQDLGKLFIGETAQEAIEADLKACHQLHEEHKKAIDLFENKQDYVSRKLAVKHSKINEDYIDLLESFLTQIKDMGIANFLQSQLENDQ